MCTESRIRVEQACRRLAIALLALLLVAPSSLAQTLPSPRFNRVDVRPRQTTLSWVQPSLCERSKHQAVVRGAWIGFGVFGSAALSVLLFRVVRSGATLRPSEEFPVLAVTLSGAALFAYLEAVEWERQCG